MKKNKLGHSDLYVSELGFGCMSLTNDDKKNERILHAALEQGVNFFDTADLYSQGMNEVSIGKALKGKRQEIILATKGGNEWGDGIDGWRWNPTKKYIKEAVKHSLRRLGTDYIDLYQLHGGTIEDPIDETIEAFEELVEEGTIRYYGISSIRPNVIKEYLRKSNIVSIMMQYSLLDRRPEEYFQIIEKQNVSVIARGPVAKGLLTDNYHKKISESGYLDYSADELKETVELLNEEAKHCHLSLQQIALRYVLDQSIIATAVPGASHIGQLFENVTAADVKELSKPLLEKLSQLTNQSKYKNHRN